MECFYYVTSETNPYRNLALEELLLRQQGPESVLLYLWQNDDTVVIGHNQNAWRECRLASFEAEKGRLARRLSGGGAVYHDRGNQNFSFLADKRLYDFDRQSEVICRAVRAFDIETSRSGRNDILAKGRKFSGNAYHKTETAALHHGTILISSDLTRLDRFLAPSPEKLAGKGVESVRGRVMNLAELNPDITPDRMRSALLGAFEEVYGVPPKPLPMGDIDVARWEALTARYASEEWKLGKVSDFQLTIQNQFSFGELEILLEVEKGYVSAAQVYSDAMDAEWVCVFSADLLGRAFTADGLAEAVPPGSDQAELADYLRARIL